MIRPFFKLSSEGKSSRYFFSKEKNLLMLLNSFNANSAMLPTENPMEISIGLFY